MDNQSFNVNTDLLGGFTGIFLKIFTAIILIYAFIFLLNFFRDKFLNQESKTKEPQIIDLLIILNKLCFLAGFGFVIGNILQVSLNQMTHSKIQMHLGGQWDNLTFGVILIFIGMGFKAAKNMIQEENR